MNRKSKLKLVAIAFGLLMTLVMAIFLQDVYASAPQVCIPSTPDYVGRVLQSCKDVIVTGNWYGRMTTKITSGSALSKIGWNSWTDTRFCDGTAINWYNIGPSYAFSSKSFTGTSQNHTLSSPPCDGTEHEARVYGNHYWEQAGYSPRTSVWEDYEGLPLPP